MKAPRAPRSLLVLTLAFTLPAGITAAPDGRVDLQPARLDPSASVQPRVAGTSPETALIVQRLLLSDNGDDDGWADTGETISMSVELRNGSDTDLTDVTVRLMLADTSVGCITQPLIYVGTVLAGEIVVPAESFEWIVAATANRSDIFEDLSATFTLQPSAAEFVTQPPTQEHSLDLDFNATGGGTPTFYYESFENGFGTFTTMHLDESLNPPSTDLGNHAAGVANADGARCQYSDPAWQASASFGNGAGETCYPNANAASDAFYFGVASDRAFSGVSSLSWNIRLFAGLGYTTPTAQLEALRTEHPINLGYDRVCLLSRTTLCDSAADCPTGETCGLAAPTLSFKHQISLVDHRSITNAQPGRTSDRSVVAVQLANAQGAPAGAWIKTYPYVNVYDSQANSNFFACSFDPTDDGNTEGDFFDPTDPFRSQGPSSTCAPGFSFAHQGDTEGAFDVANVGDADGPGLDGAVGEGTWVQPAFDLSRYRGQRLRMRFLHAGRKLGGAVNYEQPFGYNPDPGDDGWWIDDVTLTDTLTTPATLAADAIDNLGLTSCDDFFCGQAGGVETIVLMTPDGATANPGWPLEIDASASTVDFCASGTLEYRLWIDVDDDQEFDPSLDIVASDWSASNNGRVIQRPVGATRYAMETRCQGATSCSDVEFFVAEVGCVSHGGGEVDNTNVFMQNAPVSQGRVRLGGQLTPGGKEVTLYWGAEVTVDIARGNLNQLRNQGFFGFNETCAANNQAEGNSFVDSTATPNSGDALFWLLRSAGACDAPAGGSYRNFGESTARDSINACPN